MLHLSRQRGALAELLVAYRFLEAGRLVSWPMVPCAYDLVVDGGDRLYRVQVKQAHEEQGERHFGHWRVRLTKRNIETGDKPIAASAIDVLAVVTTPDVVFVIPAGACTSPVDERYLNARIEIGPESKYQLFRNRFALGTGATQEVAPVPIRPPLGTAHGDYHRRHNRSGPQRKPHVRLTSAQVEQIRQLPIRWFKHQAPEGLIPLDDAARQFNVCPNTLRKVCLDGDRQDLGNFGGPRLGVTPPDTPPA